MRPVTVACMFAPALVGCRPASCDMSDFVDLKRVVDTRTSRGEFGPPVYLRPNIVLPDVVEINARVHRYESSIYELCPELASIVLTFRSRERSPIWGGIGVRLRVVRGEVPFRIPEYPIAIASDGSIGTHWVEWPAAQRPAFHAVLAASLVTPDGKTGPWRYVEIADGRRPAAYVWPPWWRNLAFVVRIHAAGSAPAPEN